MAKTKELKSNKNKKATAKEVKGVVKEEEIKEIDPELILGDEIIVDEELVEDEEDEDSNTLDADEADPFKDRWEE